MIPRRRRDLLALVLTGFVLAASALVWVTATPQPGFTLIQRPGWEPDTVACDPGVPCGLPNDPRYLIGTVTPGSEAARLGMRPGAQVIGIDGYPPRDPVDTDLGHIAVGPPTERVSDRLVGFAGDSTSGYVDLNLLKARFWYSGVLVLIGVLMLAGIMGGVAGAAPAGLVIPLAGAASMPLLADPLTRWGTSAGCAIAVIAPVLASLLLADAIASLIPSHRTRIGALAGALAAAAAAVLLPLSVFMTEPAGSLDPGAAGWLLVLAGLLVSLVPALVLAATRQLPRRSPAGTDEVGIRWLVAAAAAPAVSILVAGNSSVDWVACLLPPIYVTILVGSLVASRRIAHAGFQRDLVVTVTEAERSRLARDLHDVALQELTLLVRRLDTTGDTTGAELARTVSEHLRDLCGELHLPILDELGAGAALDWLVQQVATTTGEEVLLERADPERPPAAVELAVFRVAQEAISNAVKHGSAPILVRYVTSPRAASLSIDDAGPDTESEPGWRPGRSPIVPRSGHYGVASMQQRAEQIGALLSIRAWPSGGTRVSLEWKEP